MGNEKPIPATYKTLAAAILGICSGLPALAQAQNPFDIGSTTDIPDAATTQFSDPFGSISELGPVNSNQNKLNVVHLNDPSVSPTVLGFESNNVSTDLMNMWLATEEDANGDLWFYFAWEREPSSGSSKIFIELQSAPADAACDFTGIDQVEPIDPAEQALIDGCNPWANRQAGDFLVIWDFNGSQPNPVLQEFNGTVFGPEIQLAEFGFVESALNGDSTRGEAAINLSAAIFGDVDQCFAVANIIPGSLTGNSDQADYKDTILANITDQVSISNCGTLRVTKVTDPADGVGEFDYRVDRGESGDFIDFSNNTFVEGTLVNDGGTASHLLIGGDNYELSEDLTGEPNYALNSIVCNDVDVTSSSFSVAVSETTNCIITNELRQGTLTVTKLVVDNYDNEPAPASDFCIQIQDGSNTAPFAGDSNGTEFTFLHGHAYNVVEVACGDPDTSPPGYTASYSAECTDVIDENDPKECVITNSKDPQGQAQLTLVKNLIKNNGGTASETDWTLSATLRDDAPGVCTDLGISGDGGASGSVSVTDELAMCTYVLAESVGPAGYSASDWSCEGDYILEGNEVVVGSGGATCAITNDDIPASLTLVKNVTNDHGGMAQPGHFTLTATGPTSISGAGGASSDLTFSAGSYTLSETGPSGYMASAWSCDGGSLDGDVVTLGLGEEATCSITNDDIQPSLTVIKHVENPYGTDLGPNDFSLYVDGASVVSGAENLINAGTYTVSEDNLPGFQASAWSGDCAADGSITMLVGGNYTCEITNTDLPPELTIEKSAITPIAIPGSEMAYSITVRNIGAGPARDVVMTDILPPAGNPEENLAAFDSWIIPDECSIDADTGTMSCQVGDLALDPTPGTVDGDEATYTAVISTTVPVDYLEPEGGEPGGFGAVGSNWEVDGNLTDDNGDGTVDWLTPGLDLLVVEDAPLIDLSPDYVIDNSFIDGAKENQVAPTVEDHAVPQNKSDLIRMMVAQDNIDGSNFVALGWQRTLDLGTSNFDWEMNQSDTLSANGVTPIRTDGDVLFSFDFESSGNIVMLSKREWNGDTESWSEPERLDLVGSGYAAINNPGWFGTISNAEPDIALQPMPNNSFGEAVINMTQAFGTNCRVFVSTYVKGRSSTPFTAVLKDFIAPVDVVIDTCRTIDMLNVAEADASNWDLPPVSDSATVLLSNAPEYAGDEDGDGIANFADPDDDNDGVADEVDAFPLDPNEWEDLDGDGYGDNLADAFPNDPNEWSDADGDGVGNNSDAFPNDPSESADSDGDGVGDNADAFPNDPLETSDWDNDGIGDNLDTDDDNDGLSDSEEGVLGTDRLNPDSDGDGALDGADAFPLDPTETVDTDGDGVGDNADAYPEDPTRWLADADNDGVPDDLDAFPNDPTESVDTDGDGIGNNADPDDDNDGAADGSDAFPLDPAESVDSDGDGIGNNADPDDDNDGVADGSDAFPLDPAESVDS
ncbi:MAG: hypothetical protein PVH89_07165, partial [Gammaproteobacteria bacterium]